MNREIKFRAWDIESSSYTKGEFLISGCFKSTIEVMGVSLDKESESLNDNIVLEQFTGLKDKNGIEIYEGDILQWREPYRTTQTHTGNNIPNGSYTEPMEPAIKTYIARVSFHEGFFTVDDEEKGDNFPIMWCNTVWDEESISSHISVKNWPWDDEEEGDLQYLLSEYKLNDVGDLLEYVNGFEVIGSVFENPELIGMEESK